MQTFLYQGPIDSSVTLRLDDGKELDVMFYRGQKTVPLPADHEYIKTLVALEHLVPPPEEQAAPAEPIVVAVPAKTSKTSKEGGE